MWFFKKKPKPEPKKKPRVEKYTETVDVGKLYVEIRLTNGKTIKREFVGYATFDLCSEDSRKKYDYPIGFLRNNAAIYNLSTILREINGDVDKYHSPLLVRCGGFWDGKETYYFNTKVRKVSHKLEKHEVQVECVREVADV